MPRSRRSQGRAWNRPVHRHGQPPLRRLGAWLAWDSQQRLTQVSTPEHTATYQYDLLGRRVQRQITKPGFPPETTHYVYDGLQAVGEIRPQQSSTSLMTGLNLDEMLARVTTLNATNTTQARTYLTDALGSVMAQTQDNQSTLAGYSYSPYGQTQGTGNTEGDSVQYTGRENDNNGLYYYRARYYDPVLKRFLSEDPIGLAGGSLSFYSYVEGNPVSLSDPLGLMGENYFSPGSDFGDGGGPMFDSKTLDNLYKKMFENLDIDCFNKCMGGRAVMRATLSTGLTGIGAVVGGVISAPSGGASAGVTVSRGAQIGALAGQVFCRIAINCAKKCKKKEDCQK
ncbi:MAG: hypothetical protein ING36_06820 [Burkholderiales bacterium]|nr:hypothetical protein [Burkholderiales bacterium]